MALVDIHLSSQNALQRLTDLMMIVPQKAQGPFPVLYLLHGLSGNHTVWTRRTTIETWVEELPLIVVMPNAERSWYTDSASCPTDAFETFITRDLVEFVDSAFQTIPSRVGRALCGNSMGGYGAFRLALKHPDLFCAAASLSGAFVLGRIIEGDKDRDTEMRLIFGRDPREGRDDMASIAERADRTNLPALWMNCGTADGLIDANRRLHRRLEELDIPHEYSERTGDHSWNYWNAVGPDALSFIRRELGISAEGAGQAEQ